ncbi:MAG TPA: flagellar assembly peptidoglycan hydrolase FlgJ [Rhodanobacteraceae bacterium]|nr:flagellar assembly peptidoglycan hydrolase FlgJ [Rhodanobacteraceae bacterium]
MAVDSLASAQLALDVKGLDGLKRAATRDPRAQLKAAATQFEALFLGQMLKSMRAAGFKSSLTDNRQMQFYQSLFDQQLSQQLAGKGMGVAQMLIQQLSAREAAPAGADAAAGAARMAALPQGQPRGLAGVPPVANQPSAGLAPDPIDAAPAADDGGLAALLMRAIQNAGAAFPATASADPSTARAPDADGAGGDAAGRFVERYAGAARTAARASGVPAVVILAQAALETGWGQHQATGDSGAASHNLFGVKAGAGWNGATARGTTREFIAGRWTQAREAFRAYASEAEAFVDHARLLATSPRYAAVRNAGTPEGAARALQASGYATDPGYAAKLIGVMRQITSLVAR